MAEGALASHAHLFRPGPTDDPRTLVMLHGTGDDERNFAGLAEVLAPEMAVLAVRGNVRENGMPRFFRRLAEGRYDMEDLALRTRALGDFLQAALADHGRAPDGVVLLGYSNGANILANLLFTDGAVAPRAVLMHPLIPFAPPPGRGPAGLEVLITGGRHDPIAPLPQTERLARQLEALGARVRLELHEGGHELRGLELQAVRSFLAAAQRAIE